METHIEQTPVGERQGNHAEGAIERIRQLTGTMLAELEDRLKIQIKTFDPLHHWCWRHASWTLQLFGVTQNLTPWERVHASPYGGKLVRFAECVLARVKTATKGKPRWLRAMWLGKSDVSDCHLFALHQVVLWLLDLSDAPRVSEQAEINFNQSLLQEKVRAVFSQAVAGLIYNLCRNIHNLPDFHHVQLQHLPRDSQESKRQRIRAVNAHHHNDEVVHLEDLELDSDADLSESVEDPPAWNASDNFEDAGNIPEELWRPSGAGEPQLSTEELEAFELARLEAMCLHLPRLMRCYESCRLVARQPEHWTALSLDVADAYLTVPQAVDTVVSIWVRGEQRRYRLLRNLPGQRSGAKDWSEAFQSYLIEKLAIEPLAEAPALFFIPGSSDEGYGGGGGGLCHVDDLFAVGADPTTQRLSECVRAKYRCTISFLKQPGDEINFLKRKHKWALSDVLAIMPNPKHVEGLAVLLGVCAQRPRDSPLPTGGTLPLWIQLAPLDDVRSGIYRMCIGVLLYVSSDYPAAQFGVKTLSSMCGKPNEGAWRCLRHLVNYMFLPSD
ncbi:unnamed protein product [Symbiodinium natans]|uniref:Uncharacterized protein n=1 Tax=Symbiodinium natans TaxID=878477 RepID=A0A812V7Y5_9DINO|nr:unnamed protein product [Symbiodinium natans]